MTDSAAAGEATQLFYFPNRASPHADIAAALSVIAGAPAVTDSVIGNAARGEMSPMGVRSPTHFAGPNAVAQIVLGVPLLHPACYDWAAETLGCARHELLALLRADAWLDDDAKVHVGNARGHAGRRLGPLALAHALTQLSPVGAFVDRVVVPGLERRPLVSLPGGVKGFADLDRAFSRLVRAAQTVKRLGGSDLFVAAQAVTMQRTLEHVYACMLGQPVELWLRDGQNEQDGAVEPTSTNYWPSRQRSNARAPIQEVCLNQWLFVTTTHHVYEVDTRTREVKRWQAWPHGRLLAASRDGQRLVVEMHDKAEMILEGRALRPLERRDADLFPVAFAELTGSSFLVRLADLMSVRLDEVRDAPTFRAWSACGRFIWVHDQQGSGGIFELSSGRCIFEPCWLSWPAQQLPTVERDGTKITASGRLGVSHSLACDTSVGCFTLGHDGGWRVFDGNTVVTLTELGVRPLLQLGRRLGIKAAAFDPGGLHLAVALRDEVWIIELANGQVVMRWSVPHD